MTRFGKTASVKRLLGEAQGAPGRHFLTIKPTKAEYRLLAGEVGDPRTPDPVTEALRRSASSLFTHRQR